MKREEQLAYGKLSDPAMFREQFRLTFAGIIVATIFVIPDGNALTAFFKVFLAISAFLSAGFLIFSAAKLKYADPSKMYEVVYISERLRMRLFDWSLDIFGFTFLCFISLFLTGAVDKIPGVELNEAWSWVVAGVMLLVAISIVLVAGRTIKSRESKEQLPKI